MLRSCHPSGPSLSAADLAACQPRSKARADSPGFPCSLESNGVTPRSANTREGLCLLSGQNWEFLKNSCLNPWDREIWVSFCSAFLFAKSWFLLLSEWFIPAYSSWPARRPVVSNNSRLPSCFTSTVKTGHALAKENVACNPKDSQPSLFCVYCKLQEER